jgi:hypothetical protein
MISPLFGIIIDIVKGIRNAKDSIINNSMEYADRDIQYVNDFYEYESSALKYVLVQVKSERAYWEKRVGSLVGALDKVGMIPALIALFAIYIRPEIKNLPAAWVLSIGLGIILLYAVGILSHIWMTRLDRAIMLIEMVIEAKKSEQSSKDTTKLIQVNEPHKTLYKYLPELKSWENSTDKFTTVHFFYV